MAAFIRPGRLVPRGIGFVATAALALAGSFQPHVCIGQEPPTEADPTGGLRSRSERPQKPTGSSREELVREWDLDRNGVIDPSEAAIARERMRRGRKEIQFNSGIDPLTGRPRDEGEEAAADEGRTTASGPLDLPAEPAHGQPIEPALPGTRVPDAPTVSPRGKPGSLPAVGDAPPARPRSSAAVPGTTEEEANARRGAGDGSRRQSGSGGMSTRPGAVTGGVRAGAPAARGGYGSLAPRSDLNAGRPRGGLLPTLRSRPGLPGLANPVPAAPAAPTVRPPQVTADDIGGF